MTTPDQQRLDHSLTQIRSLHLWHALTALRSTVRFMSSGAHPDDECAPMLAALRYRDGVGLSYVCSTRGEGGQNDLGTERGAVLGALRTAEMARACDLLDMRMYWLSQTPEDPITDFGFSKCGDETMAIWGRERVLARFVAAIRREQPDILCPTFLDVPGQHGHHRAMTQAAHEVFALAADPAFEAEGLPAWEIGKLCLPARSGAGRAYDDAAPPPPVSFTVAGEGQDEPSGWSYALMGAQSHGSHRSQGMGFWPTDQGQAWPLNVAQTRVGGQGALMEGLPATLSDIADLATRPDTATALRTARNMIAEAEAAYPHRPTVCTHALNALEQLRGALETGGCRPELVGRVEEKANQLCRVIALASGLTHETTLERAHLRPGTEVSFSSRLQTDAPGVVAEAVLKLPEGWQSKEGNRVVLPATATAEQGYADHHDPHAPAAPCVEITLRHPCGTNTTTLAPLTAPALVLPTHTLSLQRTRFVVNQHAAGSEELVVPIAAQHPAGLDVRLEVPAGWQVSAHESGLAVRLPANTPAGRYICQVMLGDAPAFETSAITHPHIRATAHTSGAQVHVLVLDAKLPERSVAYIGAGRDHVDDMLEMAGVKLTRLHARELSAEMLSRYDTVLLGVFALRFAPGLEAAMPVLHNWVREGGRLVTLYHRPWDNWDPQTTPPAPLEIGSPSLRWRVTNEAAPVRVLAPDHPLLTAPNQIGSQDWQGWHKERGLYFAKSWDEGVYTPLLEMSDPDDTPLRGGLLAGEIGKGQHVHCALNLHHQMEHLTPGAFRLMANLL